MTAAVQPKPITRESYQTDLLTFTQKITLWVRYPIIKAFIYLVFSTISIAFPLLLFIILPIFFWLVFLAPIVDFPARMPISTNKPDPSDKKGSGKGFNKARGEIFLGNHRGTGREVWCSWDDFMTHIYMLATTGGGKSEAIWTMLFNFYASGSAFSLGDGKGTLGMITQGRTLARLFGVEDDFFLINYLPGNKALAYKRMTNTMNQYSSGSAADLKELLAGFALGSGGQSHANSFFEDNAAMILELVFPAFVELRDKNIINLNIQVISSYVSLPKLYELSIHPDLSTKSKGHLNEYLEKAGFDFSNPKKQHPEVTKQHSSFISHFGKAFTSLSIQYQDIYLIDLGDINMRDIIDNRRTLIYSLPALQKSGSELGKLGKLVVTAIKSAISVDLGDMLEGTVAETTLRLSKWYKVAYGLGFDEWAAYAVEDIALIPAQARGIRHSAIFSSQDYAGTEKGGEINAEQVFANARVKLFGAMEEAGKTWSKIRELISEVRTAVSNGYVYVPGILGGRYIRDYKNTEITHRAEIDIKDLQTQNAGDFYMVMRGKLSPIKTMYCDLEGEQERAAKGNDFKVNRFVKVFAPSDDDMIQIDASESFMDLMYGKDNLFQQPGDLTELKSLLTDSSSVGIAMGLSEFVKKNAFKFGIPALQHQIAPAKLTATTGEMNLLDAFGGDEPTTQSVTDNASETGNLSLTPEIEDPDDHLLIETTEAKRIIQAQGAIDPGATILSDKQSQNILTDMAEINSLLGMTTDDALTSAKMTISKINKHCYYLAPPRPSPIKKDLVDSLQKRVDELLS